MGSRNDAEIVPDRPVLPQLVVRSLPCACKLARMAGIAPIPASSGARHRHRLDRHGNRQLNAAVHRMAITQLHFHQPAKDYISRKVTEGRASAKPSAALKRHLTRVIYNTMTPTPTKTSISIS
jgi:transposase